MSTRVLALAAVSGVLLGCTSAYESTSVGMTAVCSLTDDCTFSAECDAQYIGEIVVDAAVARELWLPIQVDNRLENNADPSIGRNNSNNAHITSVEVTYTGGFPLASASRSVNFLVPAAGSATVGIPVIPWQSLALAAPTGRVQVVAAVVAKGHFDNGSTFETGEFPVAFTFCSGCVSPIVPVCTAPAVLAVTCGSNGTLPIRLGCI